MSKLPDPFREGLARGWRVTNAEQGLPAQVTCDVAIVGSGAGAGITAELLTRAGLDVVILEEGPLKTSTDFNQREQQAYAELYQEGAARRTLDKAITVLQGRCVGGTTVINWTSSFRTPADTLKWWAQHYALSDFTPEAMAPWFEQVERRLNMQPWQADPNVNNELLRKGATALGIESHVIPRNVKGCWNLGSCGMGCPTNAKQSMLVTTIPTALDGGARLFHHTRVEKLDIRGGKVQALVCQPVRQNGDAVGPQTMRVVAKHYVVSGGAINSPALLKRSDVPDPHGLLGTRTFLHPVTFSIARFAEPVNGWAGAPQSIYTDHFLHTQPIDGPLGYKIEVPPIHPALAAVLLGGHGAELAERIKALPHTHMTLALLRDGFHPESMGGTVRLHLDGSPMLHYPVNEVVLDGARRSLLSMAEMQFAAGAKSVRPQHQLGQEYTSWAQAKKAISELPMAPQLTGLGSAHVMGGCRLAGKEDLGVVRPDGVHWQVENLSVHDGSVFPTSIGANPQLSVYGTANRLTSGLIKRLGAKAVALA